MNFGISERLRAFRYPIFTAEVVTAKQYLPCRFLRKRGTAGRSSFFQRDKKQMPIAFTTLPVKRRFGKIRRFSRIANYNKIPLIMPRATRRAFQIVLLHTYKKNRTRGHGYGSQCAGSGGLFHALLAGLQLLLEAAGRLVCRKLADGQAPALSREEVESCLTDTGL